MGGRAPASAPPRPPARRRSATRTTAGRPGAAPARPAAHSPRAAVRSPARAGRRETSRGRSPTTANSDGQQAGAPQRLHARRRELVGRARQRFTAAETGSVRAKPSRTRAPRRAAAIRDAATGGGATSEREPRRRARPACQPQTIVTSENADANPDGSRHRDRGRCRGRYGSRSHSSADDADRHQRREILRPDVAGESPSGDRRRRHAGDVVSDDHATRARRGAGVRPGAAALRRRRRAARMPVDPADEAAGHEQRPALDVDGAHERGEHRRRENEPRRRFARVRLARCPR